MKTKKILFGSVLTILFVILSSTFLTAQETIITKTQLPNTAQTFINSYFASYPISYIKKDNEVFSVDYEVQFNNRMEIKFDSTGDWKEVDGEKQAIPTAFIPQKILNYVNTQFPRTSITKIKKKTFKQEIELSNGLELIFNNSGDFIKLDD